MQFLFVTIVSVSCVLTKVSFSLFSLIAGNSPALSNVSFLFLNNKGAKTFKSGSCMLNLEICLKFLLKIIIELLHSSVKNCRSTCHWVSFAISQCKGF